MRKSSREVARIDYKIFNDTGEKVDVKQIATQFSKLKLGEHNIIMDEVARIADSLKDDIYDFISENNIKLEMLGPDEIEKYICKITEMRSKFRNKHKELKALCTNYDVTYGKIYDDTLSDIKAYISDGNEARHKIRLQSFAEARNVKYNEDMQIRFLILEVNRRLQEVELELKSSLSEVTDQEIIRRKDDVEIQRSKINVVSEKIGEIMKIDNNDEQLVTAIARYEKLTYVFSDYEILLRKETANREIEKEALFKEKKLNIKLSSFKGYGSSVDFYTFKSDFEKLYSKSTPRRLMGDLLKNNHLEGQALQLVKHLTEIEDIWERLQKSYGDPKVMLEKKLKTLINLEPLWKAKDNDKAIDAISRIVTLMHDLMKLSKDHKLELKLYNSDALERIYRMLGEAKFTRWMNSICDDELEGKELWTKLIEFLEKEIRVLQQKTLVWKKGSYRNEDREQQNRHGYFTCGEEEVTQETNVYFEHDGDAAEEVKCYICGESDGHHVSVSPGGNKLIQYYTCRKFVEMSPFERFTVLREKNLCFQCLYPGASSSFGRHREGKCQREFICNHPDHSRYLKKKHILVCDYHKEDDENKSILEQYKDRYILRNRNIPDFSKTIDLTFHTAHKVAELKEEKTVSSENMVEENIIRDCGIYLLQTIKVKGQCYNIFYDNGCNDFVCRKSAIDRIGSEARLVCPGPITLGGVGGISTETQHGAYSVKLPLHNGKCALMTGVCLDVITSTFPTYPLIGKVEDDIRASYSAVNGDPNKLPKLPCSVGGEVDFMIGVKYLRYHPKPIFQLESGLTIYESMFFNADGTRGVVGGPHQIFTAVDNHFTITNENKSVFFSDQLRKYANGFRLNPDVSLLGFKPFDVDFDVNTCNGVTTVDAYSSRRIKLFNQVEETGSIITYRCVKCRNCKTCKEHDRNEMLSIREEVEQDVIDQSVVVQENKQLTTARLPFMQDPTKRLAPNKRCAMKIYQQQIKKLNNNIKDKEDVIKSEGKLQALGHVEFVSNLSSEQQKRLNENVIQNYIPWRAVWKQNSVSTPCRLVFDASQVTATGYSLNDILAKGRNGMNKLQEIFIRWSMYRVGYHTDVQKMYNSVKLHEDHWCFQRYLWDNQLNPNNSPVEKVIKTLIYGVRSSGNQAERGLRKTATLSQDTYPEIADVIKKDIYVDDCISGEQTYDTARQRADELELVLNRGGFKLKGITFSGQKPPNALTEDGETISVAGMRWNPEKDTLTLDVAELCFSKKLRGRKKITEESRRIPVKLTRRHCASKVAEVYDLLGRVMPIVSSLKLDLHELTTRKLQWDDVLPDELRSLWQSNFEMIQELKYLKFNRAIVPSDAKNLYINTLDFGDASHSMSCAAIYARFQRINGHFSCQLVFARSKIIPDGTSQPRAELIAAILNTHTGEVVKRSFGMWHESSIKLSDSKVVLSWINNDEKPLKQWVRSRVIEIKRFTESKVWFYVDSTNMVADLGTRRGATIEQVTQESEWINGYPWMKFNLKDMPIEAICADKLSEGEVLEINKETQCNAPSSYHPLKSFIDRKEVTKRYELSRYLVDPNRFPFSKTVRILAIAIKFIDGIKLKLANKNCIDLSLDDPMKKAYNYFFKKGTLEVKEFVKKSLYEKISKEQNEILYYTGRILPTNSEIAAGKFVKAVSDLSISTFCVPLLERHSPVSYSIINDIHWYNKIAKHRGIETTWRETLKVAYIIEGRAIVKSIRRSCQRCRFLNKKLIEVAMGPLSDDNLMVAPIFYVTQVDLAGPFYAFSSHNKRTTIKIWLAVFCCCTTTTINIKVMDSYNTTSFIHAFTRLACEVGYPKKLMPDEGSQLVRGCGDMVFNYKDLKQRLFVDSRVEFEVCPVGGHNMHGRVERKIKEIKLSIEKTCQNLRLSLIHWETTAAEISNSINDMPLALGSNTGDFEVADLLTPNRLRLGRNNDRSPDGIIKVSSNPNKLMRSNEEIFESWFEVWLTSHVPALIQQPKWFETSQHVKEGDIVLFLKQDASLKAKYQYGKIESVVVSRDGLIRKVNVRYQNSNESVPRYTYRSVRQLVVIHPVDELDIMQELNEISSYVDNKFKIENENNKKKR